MSHFKFPPVQKRGPVDRELEDRLTAFERLRERGGYDDLVCQYVAGELLSLEFASAIDDRINAELEQLEDERRQNGETKKFGGRYA
jgi:hypothetical protein